MSSAVVVVVSAVFEQAGTFLACRRATGRESAQLWEFPGGKVERSESHAAALVREIHEELGIEINVGELIIRSTTLVGDIRIDLSTFRVTPVGALPEESTDHDQLRWLPANELAGLNWARPDIPTVNALVELSGS